MHPDELWWLIDAKAPKQDSKWAELYDLLDD